MDLFGTGSLELVVTGKTGLLYASPGKDSFSASKPLKADDGFNYWSSPQIYASLNATLIGGRSAIAAWTPVGIAFADFKTIDRRATVDRFLVLCSDCFLSLPGWQDQWQQSNRTGVPFQAGFADFKGTGTPQAFAVWGKGLYAGDVTTVAGYL